MQTSLQIATFQSVHISALSILLLSGCVTKQTHTWPPVLLKGHLSKLRDSCSMTSKSGFTADIIFAEQGTSRMDAAWDVSGNLNGQILNPLGEDLLNFKIDSTGVLQTDVSIKQSEVLGTSLEFLAQLGTRRTRELLCSGLFLSTEDQHVMNFVQENSETEFNLATSGTQWHIQSGIYPVVHESRNANEELKIITHVSTGDWIFRQSIATIEWQGKVIGRYMRPQFLSIHSSRSSIRLSFLDFE